MNYKETHDLMQRQDLLAEDLAEEIRHVLDLEKDKWTSTGPDAWILRINGEVVLEALMFGLLELQHGSAGYANYMFQKYMDDRDRRSMTSERKVNGI